MLLADDSGSGRGPAAPSAWVARWAHLIRPGGTVLDVACGSGRNARWLTTRDLVVTGVDRDAAALREAGKAVETIVADLEAAPWPLPGRRFDAVVVTHYLWRPLFPALLAALADGGVLIYETFADGQQTLGKPSRPDFLLHPGELLQACAGLRVVAYEDGVADRPQRFVQRIVTVRPGAGGGDPPRYLLSPG